MTEAERIAARDTLCPICGRTLKGLRTEHLRKRRIPRHFISTFGTDHCDGSGVIVGRAMMVRNGGQAKRRAEYIIAIEEYVKLRTAKHASGTKKGRGK